MKYEDGAKITVYIDGIEFMYMRKNGAWKLMVLTDQMVDQLVLKHGATLHT